LGINSTFGDVASRGVSSLRKWLSGTIQSNGIFGGYIREPFPGATMEED